MPNAHVPKSRPPEEENAPDPDSKASDSKASDSEAPSSKASSSFRSDRRVLSSVAKVRAALQCGGASGCSCRRVGGNLHCPVATHSDTNPSLSVEESGGKLLFHCHGGCSQDDVRAALESRGLCVRQVKVRNDNPGTQTMYDYVDAGGELLFQVVRTDAANGKKKITQRCRVGQSGWKYKLDGVARVLYRLPVIAQAESVFVVEGEKCADVLNAELKAAGLFPDYAATTSPGGAGRWRAEYSRTLAGKQIIVLPDNDAPGLRHAIDVCQACAEQASSLKLVELPGLPKKGDVADWLAQGGTLAELLQMTEDAPTWEEIAPAADPSVLSIGEDDLPNIQINNRQLRWIVDDARCALLKANQSPTVFVRGGLLTRLHHDEDGRITACPMSLSMVKEMISRIANWKNRGADGEMKHASPPANVSEALLAGVSWPGIPALTGIVTAPVFAADGTLTATPGYNPATQLYYHAQPPLHLGDTTPTAQAVRNARDLLLKDVLGDFPFRDAASRSHALAMLLLPFARPLIDSQTPLHLVDAPAVGTGKTLMVAVCTQLFLPHGANVMTAGRYDDEWRKRLTSTLLKAPSHILIDNASKLCSSDLAAALTTPVWEDRVLGQSRNVELPVRCVWIATGNNVTLSNEIARRTVWIRLDAKTERPYLRAGFRHTNLRGWVAEHRAELVTAALTLTRAWVEAGSPAYSGKNPLPGSFERWAEIMGGILDVAEVDGFLDNAPTLYDRTDTTSEAWRGFFTEWHGTHGEKAVGVSQVLSLAISHLAEELGDKSDRSQAIKLGKKLKENVECIYDSLQLVPAGEYQGAIQYRVVKVMDAVNVSCLSPQANAVDNVGNPSATANSIATDVSHCTPAVALVKVGAADIHHPHGFHDSHGLHDNSHVDGFSVSSLDDSTHDSTSDRLITDPNDPFYDDPYYDDPYYDDPFVDP